MDGLVVGVSNRVAYIEGFFRPGALLIGEGGSKMLVVSRRKAFPPSYVNVLRMAVDEPIEPIAPIATAKALVVSDEVPEPGERVREAAWPEGRGILAPDGPANLLAAEVPHISVIASTGMGKTTLVKMLVGQAAAAGYRGWCSTCTTSTAAPSRPPAGPACRRYCRSATCPTTNCSSPRGWRGSAHRRSA